MLTRKSCSTVKQESEVVQLRRLLSKVDTRRLPSTGEAGWIGKGRVDRSRSLDCEDSRFNDVTMTSAELFIPAARPVSYTHLTLPTKRIV